MKPFRLFLISLLSICCLSSCEEDDDYVYPSVQLEFLTGRAGVNGSLATLTRDNGQLLEVAEDASATTASPGDTLRLVANYETKEVSQNGVPRVKIYALLQAISPKPEPASAFKNGVFTDPVAIQSVWKGNAYLNAVLLVKMHSAKHLFHFVEEALAIDGEGRTVVYLKLYHDDGDDLQAFTRRAYVSVPLNGYLLNNTNGVVVYFSVNTYDEGVKTYWYEFAPSSN